MTKNQEGSVWWYVLWCAITVLVSAFLLFQIQPMISKMILPWFGGGPGVWTSCMLFFQIVLLLGYGYAHFLFRLKNAQTAALIHCSLLTVGILLLPIQPGAYWKPTGSEQPTFKILLLLGAKVGLPYFLLASTGPLIQAWFARVTWGVSPYRLYALSNVGSLAGLLTYPFVFEPLMTTTGQGWLWSGAFVVFAICCAGLAFVTSRMPPARPAWKSDSDPPADRPAFQVESAEVGAVPAKPVEDAPAPLVYRALWLLFPALGSMMLLTVTHHVCQDVAVTPFLWVAPLSLYLITFIICFDNESWYLRRTLSTLAAFMIVTMSIVMLNEPIRELLTKAKADFAKNTYALAVTDWLYDLNEGIDDKFDRLEVEAGGYLLLLFLVCMVCHGELVRRKPAAKYLTEFYLMTSAGGALGGIFVGLICPMIFPETWELNIGILACFVVAATVLVESASQANWKALKTISLWSIIFGCMLLVVRAQFQAIHRGSVATERNFYGVLRVNDVGTEANGGYRALYNGRILHGLQSLDPLTRRTPNSYYDIGSGIGVATRRYASEQPIRMAVVGLGTGTMATFIHMGDSIRFYEINPKVKQIAETYFTYLKDCPGTVEVTLGDARLEMERELKEQGSQDYDFIVLDAFSGDAIPVHLLTKEAFEIYFGHLRPNGVLAVHISNRHLELTPVVDGLAHHFQYQVIKVENPEGPESTDAASDWMLVTKNEALLNDSVIVENTKEYQSHLQPVRLWTDQYSNMLEILRSRYKLD